MLDAQRGHRALQQHIWFYICCIRSTTSSLVDAGLVLLVDQGRKLTVNVCGMKKKKKEKQEAEKPFKRHIQEAVAALWPTMKRIKRPPVPDAGIQVDPRKRLLKPNAKEESRVQTVASAGAVGLVGSKWWFYLTWVRP